MSQKTWLITDATLGQHQAELHLDSNELGLQGASVQVKTLQGGLSDGVQTVELITDRLRVIVLPTRGMSIWKAWSDGVPFGWSSPVPGPVHPKYLNLKESSGLGWLDGFDELLVRCGLESNGAPEWNSLGQLTFSLHGRIGNLPANKLSLEVDQDRKSISLIGEVFECRFHFMKVKLISRLTLRLESKCIDIHDTIENLSASSAECQMIYHTNFGAPVLEPGSHFLAPVKELVPINNHTANDLSTWQVFPTPNAASKEQVWLMTLLGNKVQQSSVVLSNAVGDTAVDMTFSIEQMPAFTLWKNSTDEADGYVTGLEPGTNYPNPRSFEGQHGRVVKLAGKGDRQEFDLSIALLTTTEEVNFAKAKVLKLQGDLPAQIHSKPQEGWCVGTKG